MKNILFLLLSILVCLKVAGADQGPGTGDNYILSRTYLNESGSQYYDDVNYHDNLGRPYMTNSIGASPSGKDLLSHIVYDKAGRPAEDWLPVPYAASGKAVSVSVLQGQARTYYGDNKPYSVTVYEQSPLARPVRTFLPGAVYHNNNKFKEQVYSVVSNMPVRYKVADNSTVNTLSVNTGREDLFVTRSVDEDGNYTDIYTDVFGQKVIEIQNNELETHYIYDLHGNLRVVLPPEAAGMAKGGNITGAMQVAFQYLYDSQNRCIAKKTADAGWIYYVYDKADRLILAQDANQRTTNTWSFTIPDVLGRPVISGTCTGTYNYLNGPLSNVIVKASWANTTNTYKGYTISGISLASPIILSVNYYDTYEFIRNNSVPTTLNHSTLNAYDTHHANCTGMLTGTITAEIGSSNLVYTAYYYDGRLRLSQSRSRNHLGGMSIVNYQYDFTDNIRKKHESHQVSSTAAADIILTQYDYDNRGRMLSETTTLNGQGKGVVKYAYNELGQLEKRTLGEASAVTENYKYNTQGWLTEQSSDLFDMKLRYYDRQKAGTEARWSGDITEWEWQHKGAGANNAAKNTYAFTYDQTGRLLDSKRYEGTGSTATSKFTEQGISYDKNGNILTMKRYSSAGELDDNFNYIYEGNQLKTLSPNRGTTDLGFPGQGFHESYTWVPNNGLNTLKTTMEADAAKGFSGAFERFDVVPTGNHLISIANTFVHYITGVPEDGVWITAEYRSSVDIVDVHNNNKLLLKANTGKARKVIFHITTSSVYSIVRNSDAWLELRTLKIEAGPSDRVMDLGFPGQGFHESYTWVPNNGLNTSKTTMGADAARGFSGAFERFDVVPTGNHLISIANTFVHYITGVPEDGVWITAEYRSSVDIVDVHNNNKLLLKANTGKARKVIFHITTSSVYSIVRNSDAWLELRTLKIMAGPSDRVMDLGFPGQGFHESYTWVPNNGLNTSKTTMGADAAKGFSGAFERFDVVPTGNHLISIANTFVHYITGVPEDGVWITAEYRSSVDIVDVHNNNKLLLKANTSQARKVTFHMTTSSVYSIARTSGAWLELRTLEIEAGPANAKPGATYHYAYDANGNMTTDGLHGLTLEYNHMNLVQTVKEGNTVKAGYRWLADGTKTGVNTSTGFTGTGYEYLGSLVYKRTGAALSLESASFGGGRIYKTSNTYTPRYFITDHLGSTRVVLDGSGNYPRNDYYAFGMTWNNPAMQTGTNRYLYNGKESQKDFGITYLDYGARKYDARIGRWFNIDPLAEKYYGYSPYVYVGNKPLRYIDPDGKRLFPAANSTKEYKKQIGVAVQFMNSKGTAGLLKAIHDHEGIVYIKETSGSTYFNKAEMTIYWDPKLGVETDIGVKLSPATALNHEADHALRALTDMEGLNKDHNTADKNYDNKEDRRVITGSEQRTALKHGEIMKGQVTRTNHRGRLYKTSSPITTRKPNEIEEVVVRPRKNKEDIDLQYEDLP